MKNGILAVTTVLLLSCAHAFGAEVEADSKISGVVVYQDSALITRTADVKLTNTGEYAVVFKDIIPDVDENSLRVKGEGTARVKIFGASVKKEFMEKPPSAKVREIQDAIQSLQDESQGLKNVKLTLAEEKNFLDSIRLFSQGQLPKDLVTKMPSPAELEGTLAFLSGKLEGNFKKHLEVDIKLRDLDRKIDVLRRELNQLVNTSGLMKRSIAVDVGVEKEGSLTLQVSYLVRGAIWQPVYDARASLEKASVEFVSYGIVRQTTGEEWTDVDLYLSTAKPSVDGRMPYVSPWFLRPYAPPVPVRRAAMMRQAAVDSGGEQFEAYNSLALSVAGAPAEKEMMEEADVAYTQAQERGVSVVYKIPRKATVKSDGSEQKLPVSSQVLKADFEYSTHPRLSPFAYLGSRVKNADHLQFLAGRVHVFLDGDFVGTSSVDNIGPGEEFDLYLGIDENVKVKREQIEKKVDDVLIAGIPSPNRKTTLRYKTTIENYKNAKAKVIFFEAMPVSENEQIKVKLTETNLDPKEKDWKDRKGVWRFELVLEPGQKQEIIYGFFVEHPRGMNVEGL